MAPMKRDIAEVGVDLDSFGIIKIKLNIMSIK